MNHEKSHYNVDNTTMSLNRCNYTAGLQSVASFAYKFEVLTSSTTVHLVLKHQQVRRASLLTVWAFLGTGSQQKLGHGHVIGHDGDIERQEALAVWSVEVQLLQTVLGKQQLNQVQLLVLHRLKQSFVTLELLHKEDFNHDVRHFSECMQLSHPQYVCLYTFGLGLQQLGSLVCDGTALDSIQGLCVFPDYF